MARFSYWWEDIPQEEITDFTDYIDEPSLDCSVCGYLHEDNEARQLLAARHKRKLSGLTEVTQTD